jgi:hypothetical protein
MAEGNGTTRRPTGIVPEALPIEAFGISMFDRPQAHSQSLTLHLYTLSMKKFQIFEKFNF